MAKLTRKLTLIPLILCAMGGLSLYRIDMLHWGATLINRDNSLPDPIMLFSVPIVLGGVLLGLVLRYRRSRRASLPKVWSTPLRVLGAIAGASVLLSVWWDISFLRLVNETLLTDFPERLQQDPPSGVWVPLSGILLFGLSSLLVSLPGAGDTFSPIRQRPVKMSDRSVEAKTVGPPPGLSLLPMLPAVLGIGMAETGLRRISSGSDLVSAATWMCQTVVTGYLTILLLTAWGYSLCRLQWPAHPSIRQNLAVVAVGACFGWTMWMAIRWPVVGEEAMIAGFLLFSLPILAFTVLPLWHAILRLRRPRLSLGMALGFIGVSIGTHFWGTTEVVGDPLPIFIANSVLIAVAVALWLIVISVRTANTSAPQVHE